RDAPACIRSPIILLYFIPLFFFCILIRPPHRPTLFPYTTLFRSPTRGLRSWVLEPAFVRPTCMDVHGRCVSAHGDERQSSGKQRSEEHTSELQSRFDLVCRLLLEKKKTIYKKTHHIMN